LSRGWDKYAHRAYEELSADENQQQEETYMGDSTDFMDSRDDFLWSDREDFERIERTLSDEEATEEEEELVEVDLTEAKIVAAIDESASLPIDGVVSMDLSPSSSTDSEDISN
jgi:hypothetical protein